MSDDAATTTTTSSLFREIHRNGWLKLLQQGQNKCDASSKTYRLSDGGRVWAVLCVHDDADAFLECYARREEMHSHALLHSFNLNVCRYVSSDISLKNDEHVFTLTLTDRTVKFSTVSRDEMIRWIEALRNVVTELGIASPSTNLYSDEPEARRRLASVRDPTSPLPPTPGPVIVPAGTIQLVRSWSLVEDDSSRDERHQEFTGRVPVEPQPEYRRTNSFIDLTAISELSQSDADDNVFGTSSAPPSAVDNDTVFDFGAVANSVTEVDSIEAENPIYEPLYLTSSTGPRLTSNQEGPPSVGDLERSSRELSLKEKQVTQLNKEIQHPGGVRLMIRRVDCVNSFALANVMGSVWVLGWKQKLHPLLYHNFHIGDRILSVAGCPVTKVDQVIKLIKQISSPYVEFKIARVPFGKAVAIKRDFDGQDLGLIREGTTAEIRRVMADGLAARSGLPLTSADESSVVEPSNWMLTEINGRPLNFFFKGNEINERLQAVGKDISILVQPTDFVKILKKELKSLHRYKDYIVQ